MSVRDPSTLERALAHLLTVYRAETTPTDEEQARLWARLATPVVPATTTAASTALRLLIGGAVVVGASAAAWMLGEPHDPPTAPAVAIAEPTITRDVAELASTPA